MTTRGIDTGSPLIPGGVEAQIVHAQADESAGGGKGRRQAGQDMRSVCQNRASRKRFARASVVLLVAGQNRQAKPRLLHGNRGQVNLSDVRLCF